VDTVQQFIATLGFPIFVAVWLMIRDVYFLRKLESHMRSVECLLGVIAATKEGS